MISSISSTTNTISSKEWLHSQIILLKIPSSMRDLHSHYSMKYKGPLMHNTNTHSSRKSIICSTTAANKHKHSHHTKMPSRAKTSSEICRVSSMRHNNGSLEHMTKLSHSTYSYWHYRLRKSNRRTTSYYKCRPLTPK